MGQAAIMTPEAISISEPEVGKFCEVVNARIVEKPPMGNFQGVLASLLVEKLAPHVRSEGLGRIVSEVLFKLDSSGKLRRRPDLAFVSYERWERGRKINSANGWDVIPDLTIEVISPSDLADEVILKIRNYFEAGVLRVWVVYSSVRQVCVYESRKKVVILGEGDDLDGGDLLPGFRLSLAELFEDGAEE